MLDIVGRDSPQIKGLDVEKVGFSGLSPEPNIVKSTPQSAMIESEKTIKNVENKAHFYLLIFLTSNF